MPEGRGGRIVAAIIQENSLAVANGAYGVAAKECEAKVVVHLEGRQAGVCLSVYLSICTAGCSQTHQPFKAERISSKGSNVSHPGFWVGTPGCPGLKKPPQVYILMYFSLCLGKAKQRAGLSGR